MTTAPAFMTGIALALCLTACVEVEGAPDLDETAQAVILAGYQRVSDHTVLDGSQTKQLRVDCPEGQYVLGAGHMGLQGNSQFQHTVLTYSAPINNGRGWLVNARNAGYAPRDWSLHVEISCFDAPRSYQIVIADSTSGQVEPYCPRGSVTTGGGFGHLDDTDAILDGEVSYFEPGWNGKSWLINGHAYGGRSRLRGFAICVGIRALPGYEVVTATSVLDAIGEKQLIASCPAAKVPTGAGWGALDATGAIYDGAGLLHDFWGAGGWLTNGFNNVQPSVWKLQLRMLCVE